MSTKLKEGKKTITIKLKSIQEQELARGLSVRDASYELVDIACDI